VWRVYDAGPEAARLGRLLATLLVFGRQTDREAELVLQGFQPDVQDAEGVVAELTTVTFERLKDGGKLPLATPTTWLLSTQFRMVPPAVPTAGTPPGELGPLDRLLDVQREALWSRFDALWPDTPLPELLGKTPRQAIADGDPRVEALIVEGEATSRRPDATDAWIRMREKLGLRAAAPIAFLLVFAVAYLGLRLLGSGLSGGIRQARLLSALDRALGIAREIAGRPARAVAHIKRLVREAVSPVTMDMLKLEGRLFADLMQQPETQALLKGVADQHRTERGG
jgi:hypothetical protein